MRDDFSWNDLSIEERLRRSKVWFKDFFRYKGRAYVKISKSTGKPHLYIWLRNDEKVAVTWKKGDIFVIHYGGNKVCKLHKSEALRFLRDRDRYEVRS